MTLVEQLAAFVVKSSYADLTLAVVTINGWNRLAISFRTVPGTDQAAHPEPG